MMFIKSHKVFKLNFIHIFMPRNLPISQEIWTLFVLVIVAIAVGGSVVVAFLINLFYLILAIIFLILLVIGVIWFINNEMSGNARD